MSVAVCRSSAAACFESILSLPAAFPAVGSTWLSSPQMVTEQQEQELELYRPTKNTLLPPHLAEEERVKDDVDAGEAERPPGQFDIWSSIQADQKAQCKEEPYVHPLMRRSSSLLTQKSLEICTESLGSETGSDDFFSSDDDTDFFSLIPKTIQEEQRQQGDQSEYSDDEEEDEIGHVEWARSSGGGGRKELATVNYHCSMGRRSSQPRSFPPPLPSISRRDGPCFQMRPHRRDGRLVVEAVTVPSQNYLHAERHNGRLLLSFINTTSSHNPCDATQTTNNAAENTTTETGLSEELQQTEAAADEVEVLEVEEEQAAEEEVEVVDRGTVVEVKVSTQPQQNSSGGAAALKVHRSSIVINKFVSCMPANNDQENAYGAISAAAAAEAEDMAPPLSPVRRLASTSTTTAAAAAVAASSLSALSAADGSHSSSNDNKLLFTSRRRNREELLHDMRRCSQLRKPLFIWEPCCIATSS